MATSVRTARQQVMGMGWANVVLGLWLVASPFILGYGDELPSVWHDGAVGTLLIVLAGTWIGFRLHREKIGRLLALVGLWLVVSPFALGYATTQTGSGPALLWNHVVVGVLVAVAAFWSMAALRSERKSRSGD